MKDEQLIAELRFNADELRNESPNAPVAKLYLANLLARAADELDGTEEA